MKLSSEQAAAKPIHAVQLKNCPECGAHCDADESNCWLCFHRFSTGLESLVNLRKARVAEGETPTQTPPQRSVASPSEQPARQTQFSLSTLMMVMTLSAVLLGVGVAAPGWGILLAIIVFPALVRTFASGRRSKNRRERRTIARTGLNSADSLREHAPLTPAEKTVSFAASFGLMTLIGVVGCAAFYLVCAIGLSATCKLTSLGTSDFSPIVLWVALIIVLLVSVIAAIAIPIWIVIFLIGITWPKR